MFDANDTLRVIDVVAVDETRPLQSMYGDMLLDDYNGVCVAVRRWMVLDTDTTDAICPEIVKVGCSSMHSWNGLGIRMDSTPATSTPSLRPSRTVKVRRRAPNVTPTHHPLPMPA